MKKNISHCLRCLHAYACLLRGMLPPIGRCTVPSPDGRDQMLRAIGEKVRQGGGSVALRKKVTVERPEVGFTVGCAVLRVAEIPSTPAGTLRFRLGDDLTTDDIDDGDLAKILQNIS